MKIVIISDINGLNSDGCFHIYQKIFEHNGWEIVLYDSKIIAGIDQKITDKELIHKQFMDFGIENSINFLVKNHPINDSYYLGFSIGGYILYEAAKKGLSAKGFYCISSTRLRFQTDKLEIPSKIIFGELDMYRPGDEKLCVIADSYEVISGKNHEFYELKKNILVIVLDIIFFFKYKISDKTFEKWNELEKLLKTIDVVYKITLWDDDQNLKAKGNIDCLTEKHISIIKSNIFEMKHLISFHDNMFFKLNSLMV